MTPSAACGSSAGGSSPLTPTSRASTSSWDRNCSAMGCLLDDELREVHRRDGAGIDVVEAAGALGLALGGGGRPRGRLVLEDGACRERDVDRELLLALERQQL